MNTRRIPVLILSLLMVFMCGACANSGGEVISENSSPSEISGSTTLPEETNGSTTDTMATADSTAVSATATATADTSANKTTKTTAVKQTAKSTTKKTDGFKGTTYYVSSSTGNDWNEGTDESTPLKSLSVAATVGEPGDRVLFKRGDIWRGDSMSLRSGVTYDAYGTGANPQFYGSAQNYAEKGKWKQTSNPRVYCYDGIFSQDIGGIVFNNGEDYAIRVFKQSEVTSKNKYYFGSDKKVYLFCRDKNPAEAWKSIEFIPDMIMMNSQGIKNVTVRNITMKYVGRVGFHTTGTVQNVRIENCEFLWMGGVLWGTDATTRLGNAITLWGTARDIVINKCKFDQIYDTAFTPQYAGGSTSDNITFENIVFSNNTVNRCHWSTEFWIDTKNSSGQRTGTMKNIQLLNNVFRNAGGGWSANQRGTAGGLTSASHIETFTGLECASISDFVIKGNTFDWSAGTLLAFRWNRYTPVFEGNTFIQTKGKVFGYLGETKYKYDDDISATIHELDKTAIVKFAG